MRKEPLQNKEYDLVSVIYNASQAVETCKQYIQDAQGDQEIESFFNNVVDSNCELVEKGKELLKTRLH